MKRTRRNWSLGLGQFLRGIHRDVQVFLGIAPQISGSKNAFRMRSACHFALVSVATLGCLETATAHEPNRACDPVTPRVDLIGPIGNNLPIGHRRKYNRPSYLEGKLAYLIAPSSQEAMAWHHAEHTGAYTDEKKCHRYERHYWYPKPWQVLRVGQRPSVLEAPKDLKPISNGLESESENELGGEQNEMESLELPAEDEIELQKPLSMELESTFLPEPMLASQVDDAIGFAAVSIARTPELASKPSVKNLEQASGSEETSRVSRGSVSQTSGTLEKPSKVAWFKQLLQKGIH